MRDASSDLADAILGSFSVRLIVDVFYGQTRTFANLPVTDWAFKWDAESQIKSTGTLTVVYQGDQGDSLSPTEFLDRLAPFGQQVAVLLEVGFGEVFTETIQLGRFRVNVAPQAVDTWFGFAGRPYTESSTVTLTVDDLLSAVQRWGFRWPAPPNPRNSGSTWAELQRISGLPIVPNLPDKATPTQLVYQPVEGSRLTAVQQLMSYLGGVAVVNSLGELTSLPFDTTTVVNTLTMGTQGRVLAVESGMDSTGLYNCVVGTYQAVDGSPIYSTAQVTSGPLSVWGPFGEYTHYDQSDTVSTGDQANARTRAVLAQLLAAQTYRVTVTAILDPRAEIGDVVTVTGPQTPTSTVGGLSDPAWTVTGRIISLSLSSSSRGLMTVTLDVARDVGF